MNRLGVLCNVYSGKDLRCDFEYTSVLLCLFTKQLEMLFVPQRFGMVAHTATDIPPD